jgi:hypothetical protein
MANTIYTVELKSYDEYSQPKAQAMGAHGQIT